MQRINTSDGQFHPGNPATGELGTIVTRDFMQSLQEEIAAIPESVGIALDPTDNAQVLKAMRRLIQAQAILVDSGAANAYAATNTPALKATTWTDGVTQIVKVANANTGQSTFSPDGLTAIPILGMGFQPLQAGELRAGGVATLVRQTLQDVNGGNPFCVLVSCQGGAMPVAPATKSNHAVQLGQIAGLILNYLISAMGGSGAFADRPAALFPNQTYFAVDKGQTVFVKTVNPALWVYVSGEPVEGQ